ncbi:MAG: histidinol-phosphatase [Bauldia sp.]|jgi:myo-inositol-1(or 4)-monophosphatase
MSPAFVHDSDEATFLAHLADIAGAAILPHFRSSVVVDSKGDGRFDPVTVADRNAEEVIRAAIALRYPGDGIVGEEFGTTNSQAERVWVIDPIDGTRSFIAGLPVWGVLVGLLARGRPTIGMMAQPFTGERFFGDGARAWFTGPGGPRDLAVRACASLGEAVLFTTAPNLFTDDERPAYDRVEQRVRLARYGADCYAYCMVAAGFVDAVVEAGLQTYDIVPLIPIIEGAGGRVTDWDGNPALSGGRVVATGDARLHDRILDVLRG